MARFTLILPLLLAVLRVTVSIALADPTPSAAAPSATPPLRFDRLLLNTGGRRAEMCLRFDSSLDDNQASDYATHITLVPAAKPEIRIEAKDLCIGGLSFGTRYALTLTSGIRGAAGERLASDLHLMMTLADQPATVALAGDGYVLARTVATGIEVQTVNVAQVRIHVFRMSQASAVAKTSSAADYPRVDLSATSMNGYEVRQLRNGQVSEVWTGTMEVEPTRNRTVRTAFPIGGIIRGQRPGLYLVTAENATTPAASSPVSGDGTSMASNETVAAHWVNVSDIGLGTIEGRDGLHVVARSLATGLPMPGVQVVLNATGRDVLDTATTDANGAVAFAPGLIRGKGAEAPASIVATGPAGDFAAIQLGAWFDFSDRGAEGKEIAGLQQAIVTTERGVYRPGEMVQTTVLLRDHLGAAIHDQPLVLVLTRPDGVEERRLNLPARHDGGFVMPLRLTASAPLGSWTLLAYADPTSAPIGRASFAVQDFVPQVLAVALSGPSFIVPGAPAHVTLAGRFLYGAPAAGLHGDGTARVVADPSPVPAITGYVFGLAADTVPGKQATLTVPDANAEGNATIDFAPVIPNGLSLPLMVSMEAGMQDPGGRSVTKRISIPVRRSRPLIGLKPHDAGGDAGQQTATVEIATFDPDGKGVPVHHMAWTVVRENEVYDWYGDGGGWSFRMHVIDEPISQGSVDTGPDGRARIAPVLDQARYRVVVSDTATGAATSTELHVGWWAPQATDASPDRLDVVARDKVIRPGGSTTIHISPRYAGEAQVTIAGDRVFSTRTVHVPAAGIDLPVKADPGWEGGAYVLVTLYRPLDQPARPHDPVRTVGLAWIGLDESAHRLDVSLHAPELALPRRRLSIPVLVHGAASGDQAHLTLAAVDEGVLGVTGYAQADPFDLLFGKRRLGVDVTDTYAHLLDGSARAGRIHEGGDESSGPTGLAVTSTRIVSLFSGDVQLDRQGRGTVTLEVPDFEGRLRIMATAWSADGVGMATSGTTIRDPVFPDLSLPRFLAPGDTARDAVSIADTDGPDGTYRISLQASGAVRVGASSVFQAELKRGQRRQFSADLTATTAGVGHVVATLTGSGVGPHPLVRDWQIEVRPAHAPMTVSTLAKQMPGQSARIDPALLAGYDQGSTTLTVGYSGFGGIDTIGLLQSLETGGWGSSEDLAAQAWPLLHFREPGLMGRLPIPGGALGRIQETVDTLLDREDAAGRIGQWHLNDGGTLPWTQIYLVDFLTRARDAGLMVDAGALGRALDWLDESQVQGGVRQSDDDAVTPESRAYALFVLARAGRLNAPAIRSMHDDLVAKTAGGSRLFLWGSASAEATKAEPLALGHMAAALALDDQHDAGHEAFTMAVDNLGPPRSGPPPFFDFTYWIYVRDLAGVTALAADAHDDVLAQELVDRFDMMTLYPPMLNDQEKAGLLDVASSMDRDDPERRITVNGRQVATPVHLPASFSPTPDELGHGYVVANVGTKPMWLTTTVTGTPTQAPPVTDAGYSVAVHVRSLDDKPVDTAHMRQNDRFVVVISGQADGGDVHHTILVDRLPAGWEIESMIAPKQEQYGFLGELTPTRSVQAQDDRYFAVFDTDPSKDWDRNDPTALQPNQFRLAYVVRAVTPGHFVRPETVATDQYRPTVTGRTAAATTDIDSR